MATKEKTKEEVDVAKLQAELEAVKKQSEMLQKERDAALTGAKTKELRDEVEALRAKLLRRERPPEVKAEVLVKDKVYPKLKIVKRHSVLPKKNLTFENVTMPDALEEFFEENDRSAHVYDAQQKSDQEKIHSAVMAEINKMREELAREKLAGYGLDVLEILA